MRLLANPAAGRFSRGDWIDRIREIQGVRLERVSSAEDLAERAARAARGGAERLLVAGGDGSVHHAVRGLAGSGCALGIVPVGSGNDLARSLGVPADPMQAIHRALTAVPRRIDLGAVDGRRFAGIASLGLDAAVASSVHGRFRSQRGPWLYPYALVRTLLRYRPPTVRIESDAGSFEGPVMLAALANAPYYGAGMRLAPGASLDDGRLQLVIIRRMSRLRLLLAFPKIYRGRHTHLPAVRILEIGQAHLHIDPPSTFFADGEPLTRCDASGSHAEVLPGGLWVAA